MVGRWRFFGSFVAVIALLLTVVTIPEARQAVVSSADLNAAYALETRPSRTINATYTYSVFVPRLSTDEWELFAPRPVDLPGQQILRVAASPQAVNATDASPLRQPLICVRAPATSPDLRHAIVMRIDVDATLIARRLVAASATAQVAARDALPEAQRTLALAATSQFDFRNNGLKAWLAQRGLIRATQEGDVDFARRVFQAITRNFLYDYRGEQDRTASHVAAAGKSDCGGLAALFVSALRSQGVPARTLAGRWAISARPGQRVGEVMYFQEHVKAEFFAEGVGWVPVDLSSAVLHDRSPEKLRYFGNDPGDFLTWHLDTGLTVDTRHFGRKTYTLLQRPCYWVTGSGSMDGSYAQESWTVGSRDGSDSLQR